MSLEKDKAKDGKKDLRKPWVRGQRIKPETHQALRMIAAKLNQEITETLDEAVWSMYWKVFPESNPLDAFDLEGKKGRGKR